MNDKELLEKFFRALRITLTNASSYSKDHPYFIKSVENFKTELEDILIVYNPFKIGITNLGIMANNQSLPQGGFYDELTRLLHQRKIKSIEIRKGADLGELLQFFYVISLPQKEMLRSGGINAILEHEILVHFIIEELDYSEFLYAEGQECSDIWGYLFKDVAKSKDGVKLEMLANDFGPLIKRSSQQDLLASQEILQSIGDFLISLKEENREKFNKCSKDVFLWFLHNKKSLNDEDLEKLEPILKCLNQEDFSNLLWEGITQEDNFDDLSLQLFSKITAQKNPSQIADNFLTKIRESRDLKNNPGAIRKIHDLLSSQKTTQLSDVYRNTLGFLVKGISLSGGLFFDQKMLRENYRYIVLNMLLIDQIDSTENVENLVNELAVAFEDDDLDFLKSVFSIILEKRSLGIKAYIILEKKFSAYVENIVLNQLLRPPQEIILEMVSSPSQEVKCYLDKIFELEKVNSQVLGLFFRLFPGEMDKFYEYLEPKVKDLEFVSSLINALGQIGNNLAVSVLEYIYFPANELIKKEILIILAKLNRVNVNFLLPQLSTSSFILRKNLFSVLVLDEKAKRVALETLFNFPSFLGRRNELLMENIQIVADLKFKGARDWLTQLSQRRFLWNKKLRNKAKNVLKELDAN